MNRKPDSSAFCFIILFAVYGTTYSQTVIHGMVADSATLLPLSTVSIRIKNQQQFVISDQRGNFKIEARESDTLSLTMVGYRRKLYPVKKLQESMVIYLSEESILLKPIEINALIFIPGLDKMQKESGWKNPTSDPARQEVPGAPVVQTFGPGIVARGLLSKNSKSEKEKTKLKKVQEENRKSQGYVSLVNSAEVKDKLMKDYALTEEKYYNLLAAFNEKNRDLIYELNDEELISLILVYFQEELSKK